MLAIAPDGTLFFLAGGRLMRTNGGRPAVLTPVARLGLARTPELEALGPLVGENLGVERASIDIHEDGLRHSVKIGDAVDFEIEDVVSFGVESGEPARLTGIFHPAGSELTIAKATRTDINAFGIEYEGKSAFSSAFAWAA